MFLWALVLPVPMLGVELYKVVISLIHSVTRS